MTAMHHELDELDWRTVADRAPTHVGWSRRNVLRAFGLGAATVVVAATGALSYRVYDTAALDPGSGNAFEPWNRWQEAPGPRAPWPPRSWRPARTTPSRGSSASAPTAIDLFVDRSRSTGAVDPYRA